MIFNKILYCKKIFYIFKIIKTELTIKKYYKKLYLLLIFTYLLLKIFIKIFLIKSL